MTDAVALNGRSWELGRLCDTSWHTHKDNWLHEFEHELWQAREALTNGSGAETRMYAIFEGRDAIKLGVAKDPQDRLYNLQIANHRPLTLFTSCPSTVRLEKFFHTKLLPWRIRGEWFSLDSHVLAAVSLIASMNDVEQDLDGEAIWSEDVIGCLTWRFDDLGSEAA